MPQADTLGDEHPDVAQSLNNLALLYDNQGRYGDAEPLYLQDIAEQLLGEEHPNTQKIRNNFIASVKKANAITQTHIPHFQLAQRE